MRLYVAVAAGVVLAAQAGATVTPTVSSGQFSANQGMAGFSTITFDGVTPGTKPANITGDGAVVSTNLANKYTAPTGDATPYFAVAYNNSVAVPAQDVLSLGASYTYFGLYWGSLDDFNTVTFLNSSGNVVQSFSAGSGVIVPADHATSRYVNFAFTNGDSFNSVRFDTQQANFELDNVTYGNPVSGAVPEPASWALMVGGFGLTGAALRRRRQSFRFA